MPETTVQWKDDSEAIGEVLYQFEIAFKEGKDPKVESFLQGEGAARQKLLIELLHSDMELRLRAGQSIGVSSYLSRFPELAHLPGILAALLGTEVRVLKQLGKQPLPDEYENAYGQYLGSRVKEILEVATQPPKYTDALIGTVIGKRYKIIKPLGQGGMGTVYLAEQSEPVKRQVALKLISAGIDSRNYIIRFEAERQALAMMDHPNIARVYDGGTTEQRQPYFVMELVQGIPITKYCDQHRLHPKARLELFVLICQAVQHAHQKGIIHRDLKPGNVLITEVDGKPVPKVIDFGLAKATEQPLTDETIEDRGAVGTPAYMSPEQADPTNFDVDTRTDVYALGVILYELLTGHTPIDIKQFRRGALLEMLRMVREVEPPKPSTKLSSAEELPSIAANRDVEPKELLSWVRGDIDWIVMKALEKDRDRRYETANGFAADVMRYLNSEPVAAHPPSKWYLARKFIRRNKGKVVVAAIMFLALTTGIAGTSWGLYEAKIQETNARKSQKKEADERARADERATEAIKQKERADSQTEETRLKSVLATNQKQRAERLLTLQALREGFKQMELGYRFKGLLWLSQPLVLARDQPEIEKMTRLRLGTYHGLESKSVMLTHCLVHQGAVKYAMFSPDGRYIVTASDDKKANVWDIESGVLLTSPFKHQEGVYHATFSPNGLRILTIAEDKTASVWSIDTGQLVIPPLQHKDTIYSAKFSPDGRYVVTASADKTALVWDTTTGKPATPPLQHLGSVYCATFSPDGHRIVTASEDKTACVWDAQTGRNLTPPLQHEFYVTNATFSPDSSRIVTTSYREAKIWDAYTGHQLTPKLEHTGGFVSDATFSPDSRRIVTASSWDKSARMWDVSTGQLLSSPMLHNGDVRKATFSQDGRYIVTVSSDRSAQVWSAGNCQRVIPSLQHIKTVNHATFSPDGRRLATSSDDNVTRIYSLCSERIDIPTFSHVSSINSAVFSSDGTKIISASHDRTAKVWDLLLRKPMFVPILHGGKVNHASFSPDGKLLVTASDDNTAQIRTSNTGRPISSPFRHKNSVEYAEFSKNSKLVITASSDNTAQIWNVSTSQPVSISLQHMGAVNHAAFSPDSHRTVTASQDSTARLWDASSGKQLMASLQHNGPVNYCCFSPDSNLIVTASSDSMARIWDSRSGLLVTPPLLHHESVNQATFSPNGTRIVTASADGTARIWDSISGQPVTPPLQHEDIVLSAKFSPDGKLVVTSSADCTARVWDASNGHAVAPSLQHRAMVHDANFNPDGSRIVTASWDNSVKVWELQSDNRSISDIIRLAQVYAGHKIDDTGSLQPLNVENELLPWHKELKAKYPEEFVPTYADTRRWRLQQISDSCHEYNLPAALFHQNWLLAEAVVEAAKTKRMPNATPKPTSPTK